MHEQAVKERRAAHLGGGPGAEINFPRSILCRRHANARPAAEQDQSNRAMARTAAKFTQTDVARAIRAVDQAGADMDVVLEPDGRIRITRADAAASARWQSPVDYEGELEL